jgi:hypothetical protein
LPVEDFSANGQPCLTVCITPGATAIDLERFDKAFSVHFRGVLAAIKHATVSECFYAQKSAEK